MARNSKYKAVFLDRDGTIARDVQYCRRPEDFHFLPTVPEAVKILNEAGFKAFVITNQSGIARGFFNYQDLDAIHQKMLEGLNRAGASIADIRICPHHPDDRCVCRKPGTALFRQAAEAHGIDLSASYVIGDMAIDVQAGKSLGCRTVLVTTGLDPQNGIGAAPDFVAGTLLEAARWIIESSQISKNP